MAAQEKASEKQLELGKNVFSFPPCSIYFLEMIMSDALEEDDGKVSIGGRTITCTNLRLAMTLMLFLKKSRN